MNDTARALARFGPLVPHRLSDRRTLHLPAQLAASVALPHRPCLARFAVLCPIADRLDASGSGLAASMALIRAVICDLGVPKQSI